MATVGGTVALLAGVYVGGQVSDAFGNVGIVLASGALWLVGSLIASRIRSDLAPHSLPEDPGLLRHEVRRVLAEFGDGMRRLARTPRAVGPITSITLDQVGQGIILTLSLVVFRDRFQEGVGSFSNLLGAGGLGVLLGIATVGALEDRLPKERIVAGAFFVGGLVLLAVSLYVTGPSVLVASFATGVTFAWKKIPVDTMVQQSLPDGYRGRVFAVYDVAYNLSRLLAAAIAIPLFPRAGRRRDGGGGRRGVRAVDARAAEVDRPRAGDRPRVRVRLRPADGDRVGRRRGGRRGPRRRGGGGRSAVPPGVGRRVRARGRRHPRRLAAPAGGDRLSRRRCRFDGRAWARDEDGT